MWRACSVSVWLRVVVRVGSVSQHALPLAKWCVDMCQTMVHRTTSKSPQHRTSISVLPYYYVASRTLLWVGHVARMPNSRFPKRLMLSWV